MAMMTVLFFNVAIKISHIGVCSFPLSGFEFFFKGTQIDRFFATVLYGRSIQTVRNKRLEVV